MRLVDRKKCVLGSVVYQVLLIVRMRLGSLSLVLVTVNGQLSNHVLIFYTLGLLELVLLASNLCHLEVTEWRHVFS